jgi:hypothetical protein
MMPVKIREGAMAVPEVKSVPNLLGTPVSYAYAVKAGPWIFLSAHEAFDFESGIPEEVAGPSGFPLFGRPRSRREAISFCSECGAFCRSSAPTSATASALTSILVIRRIKTKPLRRGYRKPGQSLPSRGGRQTPHDDSRSVADDPGQRIPYANRRPIKSP